MAEARTRALLLLVLGFMLEWPLAVHYFWPLPDGFLRLGCPIGDDFINGWASIRLWADSRLDILFQDRHYTPAIGELFGREVTHHMWSYPPTALLMYLPFLHMGYYRGLAIWTACGLAAYMAVARWYLGGWRWLPLAMLLLAPATSITLIDGQNGFLTATLFIGGCLCLERYPALAGVLFGLLTFKPQLGLILPFALLTLRAWRAILFACLTAVLFAAISVALFGLEAWDKYLTVTIPNETHTLQDFSGFFTTLTVSVYGGLRHGGVPGTVCFAVQALCAAGVAIVACHALPRIDNARRRTLILACAAPLMTPYMLSYDLPLMSIPLAAALFTPAGGPIWRRIAYGAAWLAPALVMWLGVSKCPATQILCPLILLAALRAAVSLPADGDRNDTFVPIPR